MNAAVQPERVELNLKLVNLSRADAQFLQGVVSLFTDPQRAAQLAELRKGEAAIYASTCGRACVLSAQTIQEMFYQPQPN